MAQRTAPDTDPARYTGRSTWLRDFATDARYTFRHLHRSSGFALIVILTLSGGISATSTIFSIVNAVLLRPLPYQDPDRLIAVTGIGYKGELLHLQELARTLRLGAHSTERAVSLTGSGEPERLTAAAATPELFGILGVSPLIGRSFVPDEGRPGASPAVILSHAFWQQRFGGARDVLDRRITLDGVSRIVVGVMPSTFRFPSPSVDLWIPLVVAPGDRIGLWSETARLIGRLNDDETVESARAEVKGHVPRMHGLFPWKMPADYGAAANVVLLREQVVGDVRQTLIVLLAAVVAVLTIVCVNVANLMLARGMSRQREMAVRAAMGAGRGRLFRQVMAESLTLATIAGVIGFLLAGWGLRAVTAQLPADVPRIDEIALDGRVLWFTAAMSLLAGLLFGIWPALRAAMSSTGPGLRESGRGTVGAGQRHMAGALVVAEIALAVVLVTSAALLVKSFSNLTAVNPGFRTERLVSATVAPPEFRYKGPVARRAFVERLLERLREAPGVTAASAASATPFGRPAYGSVFSIAGRPDPATESGEWPFADVMATVEPDYFDTIGTPVLLGRRFTTDDRQGSMPVALVSESLAAEQWPGASAVGARIRFPGGSEWMTIVGVVADVKWSSLTEEKSPALYRPLAQGAIGPVSVVIRTDGDPAVIASAIRGIVGGLDADTPVEAIRTAGALVGESVAKPRFTASLLSLFAVVALLLGALGVYGVLAYTVSRRTREIGIRMALGARPGDVLRLVIGEGTAAAIGGIVLGLVAAFASTRALSTLLFGVSAADPAIFATVAATLLAVALLAAFIPARRASRVDPMIALRSD